jgi:autotransporter-associated beta strand protein
MNIEHGGDATKEVVFDSSGATTAKEMTVASSHTDDRTLTLPDATDTLVGRATTDTLTNKTLTSPTITGGTYSSPVLTTPQINDTSSDHQYIFAVNELTADRTVTLPLLTGNDSFVFEAHTQTLTNKTLTTPVIASISNSGTITIPTGTDTLVGRDTTDTLTNKTLTSPTINSGVLTTPEINDTSSDHQYVFAVSELAADRTVTLPLLTGNDTFVFEAHTQTLTNKTLTSPTLTSAVLTTPEINDTSSDHQYVFAVNELAADRTVTLPLLTGNDTFVFEAHTQTLTNKTLTTPVIASISNSGTITVPTGTDTLVARDTTDTLTNKTLTAATVTAGSTLTFDDQAEARFEDDTGDEYVAIKATTGTTTHTYNLPTTQGAASEVLSNDGSGNLSWAAAATTALNEQNVRIGNSSNSQVSVDTQLAGNIEGKVLTADFVDGDVNTGTDRITATSHGLETGDRVYLTTTGTLPTGLSTATEYFVLNVDANTFELATTLANAIAGTQVDITAAAGGGTHTVEAGGLEMKASSLTKTPTLTIPTLTDTSDLSKDLTFTLSGATTAKTMTISSSHTDDRTITLPDATDTLVGLATTDTLTNKTLTSPTITSGVLTTPQINDTSSDHQYVFAVNELAADRTVTLPLLTGNDTFVFEAHTQTLTNKTLTTPVIASISNSGTITVPTGTDTLVARDTTDTLTNKTLTAATITAGSTLTFDDQAEIRFEDDTGDDYVAMKATTGTTTHTYNLPTAQGSANEVLTNDGSGNLSWSAVAGGSLNEQHMSIGNASNSSTDVDTQLAGTIEGKINTGTFVDGDVAVATDRITATSNGLETGDRLYLTTTGTLPTGLSASTEYFAISVDANTFELATTLANAIAGTQIDITAAAGGGTHTFLSSGMEVKASSLLKTPTISTPIISDSSDLTKDFTIDLSGATAATTTTVASSQTADRTITLPDATTTLMGTDTTDTFTNKTWGGTTSSTRTISFTDDIMGNNDGLELRPNITTNRQVIFPNLTITAVGVSAAQVLYNKTLDLPQINDTSDNHQYVFAVNELTADRTVTLPLLTGNDEFVFKDHTVTLTNKTLSSPTVSGTVTLSSTPTYSGAVTFSGGAIGLDNAVTINDSGADVNFRVEGDTEVNLLFVDAGNDAIGIYDSDPSGGEQLSVITDGAASTTNHGIRVSRSGKAVSGAWGYNDTDTNMYIGTTTSHDFDIRCANAMYLGVNTSGQVKVDLTGWGSGSTQDVGASVTTGAGVLQKYTSSRRYKENIQPLSFDSADIYKLDAAEFTWKEGGGKDFGFIAEEVAAILPEAVIYSSDADGPILDENGAMIPEAVRYRQLVAPIIEELKKLRARVEELEAAK